VATQSAFEGRLKEVCIPCTNSRVQLTLRQAFEIRHPKGAENPNFDPEREYYVCNTV
jgi:hypothetical protein